jgi:hypothetical protein
VKVPNTLGTQGLNYYIPTIRKWGLSLKVTIKELQRAIGSNYLAINLFKNLGFINIYLII